MRLDVVVNGSEVHLEVDAASPLSAAADEALRQERATRSRTDYELRDARGRLLDQARPAADYGQDLDGWLFLNLRIGAGG